MTERLTLAESTGIPWLSLALHAGLGVVALAAGLVAIVARKGSPLHRRSGRIFAWTMIATGLTASGISIYEGKSPASGLLAAYLIFTGFTAVRARRTGDRAVAIGLMVLAFAFAGATYLGAFTALGRPGNRLEGVPAGMYFFLGTVVLLAAIGDARMLLRGELQGARRLARHLWRMCFGLFIASGSFAAQLVQMSFMPPQMRSVPVILLLGGGPLVVLVYWMWRVRLRGNMRGLPAAL